MYLSRKTVAFSLLITPRGSIRFRLTTKFGQQMVFNLLFLASSFRHNRPASRRGSVGCTHTPPPIPPANFHISVHVSQAKFIDDEQRRFYEEVSFKTVLNYKMILI